MKQRSSDDSKKSSMRKIEKKMGELASVREEIFEELQDGLEKTWDGIKILVWKNLTETLQKIQQRFERKVH